MSSTRFHDDELRIKDQLRRLTASCQYSLATPGNGVSPDYIADPHIRLQKWAGYKYQDTMDIATSLRNGYSTQSECKAERLSWMKQFPVRSATNQTVTDESRTQLPAWNIRGSGGHVGHILLENPQTHVDTPFPANVDTRLEARDQYIAKNQGQGGRNIYDSLE